MKRFKMLTFDFFLQRTLHLDDNPDAVLCRALLCSVLIRCYQAPCEDSGLARTYFMSLWMRAFATCLKWKV